MDFVGLVALGVPLFGLSNLDDVLLLTAWFADPRKRTLGVVAGQYLGIVTLIVLSLVIAVLANAVATGYVHFLGVIPIALGLRRLRDQRQQGGEAAPIERQHVQVLTVASVTIANGGDDLAIYPPVFATRPAADIAVLVGVFLAMTALWCLVGFLVASHPALGRLLRRDAERLMPFILIGLGLYVLLAT